MANTISFNDPVTSLQTVRDSRDYGLFLLKQEGQVLSFNKFAATSFLIFGGQPMAIGLPLLNYFHPDWRADFIQ